MGPSPLNSHYQKSAVFTEGSEARPRPARRSKLERSGRSHFITAESDFGNGLEGAER